MVVLGIDIASSTGWSLLKDGNLEKYGVITIPSQMNLFQRLKYFENNLIQILQDNKPDEVHIEDVILGISGAKTLAYLGRLNGVAITTCYNVVGDNIKLYTPTFWKSHSFSGLQGMSKKVDIQIAIIKHYNLIPQNDLDILTKPLKDFNDQDQTIKEEYDSIKKRLDTCKKIRNRQKTPSGEKIELDNQIANFNRNLSDIKKKLNQRKKEIENVQKSVSIALTAKCGLTSDVCDSIGIAYCNQ